jgi:molybdopterin/thiamine biosynthesis adenylyltransferase
VRYSKQSILREIGLEGQRAIEAASVLCVGVGGLGCAALPYLVAAGVGRIGIIDADVVSISNLQRQIIFQESDIGIKKVEAAKSRLNKLNSHTKIEIYPEFLTRLNSEELLSAFDIIIDATDNFEAKYLINDTAVKLGKPVVFGSVTGFEGQVAIFDSTTACYRCLYPQAPKSAIPNCEEAGVLGSVVGMIGTLQATECLKYIVSQAEVGILYTIDALNMGFFKTKIHKNDLCTIEANEEFHLIDVREKDEWEISHREGAIHIPLSLLKRDHTCLADLDKEKSWATYCVSGHRAKEAVRIFESNGFKKIRFLV